jgi:hypothetical protein
MNISTALVGILIALIPTVLGIAFAATGVTAGYAFATMGVVLIVGITALYRHTRIVTN